MAAFKDKKNGSWYVQFRYVDWKGERQQKLKRSFATKHEALDWEREFLMQKRCDPNMTFESFAKLYEKDVKPRLKLNTWGLARKALFRRRYCPTLPKGSYRKSHQKTSQIGRTRYGCSPTAIETRTAFVTTEIQWLEQRNDWKNLKCIGAIHTEFTTKKGASNEWHYYISSRKMTAEELLHHARMEWSVESMHWLLDVHFEEDWCRIQNKAVQQCLNMFRKIAINLVKQFKLRNNSSQAISNLMFECLLDSTMILRIIGEN